MADMKLVVGDRNLSSWSLRPWLAIRVSGLDFETVCVALDRPETSASIAKYSPSGLVPCLVHGDTVVWDSLAICEYANELAPDARLWPSDPAARAVARAVSSEMHSGFAELRKVWPMNIVRENLELICAGRLRRDVDRITRIWTECREKHGADGPFLFGGFTIADAMFAPVVSRFRTYGPVELPQAAQDYADAIWALPAFAEWRAEAVKEVSAH